MSSIGLIGGTGELGKALALHLSKKHAVVIGSRQKEKATAAVKSILEEKGRREYLLHNLSGGSNQEVVSKSDFVIATIPWENAVVTIKALAENFSGNQVLVSAVASLSKSGDQFLPASNTGSITEQIKPVIPDGVELASAFQTLPAAMLYKERPIQADIFVSAESPQTFEKVAEIVSSIEGLRPLFVGDLRLAGELESLTALLLNLAVKNRLKSPTFRVNSF